MIEYDDFVKMIDALAQGLPKEFFGSLSGGIHVSPAFKFHPEDRNHDLYVMGEYTSGGITGRSIMMYYGSFAAVYGNASDEAVRYQAFRTLRHEFRHHLEGLALNRDLEYIDRDRIKAYLDNHKEE